MRFCVMNSWCYNVLMNLQGILTALLSLFVIGLFHPIVVKAEYYFSKSIWFVFLILGVMFCVLSLFAQGIGSTALALVGAACLWSIKELFEQEKRVERGWFPRHPKRNKTDENTRRPS